jgi:hypothetical protein
MCLVVLLKLDLMKAYDTVRWDFLKAVSRIINFLEFVDQRMHRMEIKERISSVRLSISNNGELNGFFPEARGLSKGAPMSCHIFVLARKLSRP